MKAIEEQLPKDPASGGAGPQGTSRDLQRTALRELVLLSTESSTAEAEIEHRFKSGGEELNRLYQKTVADLERQYAQQREQILTQFEQRMAESESRFKFGLATLNTADADNHHQISLENDPIERDIKQKIEQEVWLADSVLEATQSQMQAELRKTNEAHREHVETLDLMEIRARKLLETYRQTIPPPPPSAPEPAALEPLPKSSAAAMVAQRSEEAERYLATLQTLQVPRLFIGIRPYLIAVGLCAMAATVPQWWHATTEPQWREMGIALGITAATIAVMALILWILAKSHVKKVYLPLQQALSAARRAAQAELAAAVKAERHQQIRAERRRDVEVAAANSKWAPMLEQAQRRRQSLLQTAQAEFNAHLAVLEKTRDQTRAEAERWRPAALDELQKRREKQLAEARQDHERRIAEHAQRYQQERSSLQKRWNEGLARIEAPIEHGNGSNDGRVRAWDDASWKQWTPPSDFASTVRFGELRVDLQQVTDRIPQNLKLPEAFSLPAALAFPRQASLLIHTDLAGREEAVRALQMVMTRLLTCLPPGRARFTMIDPVGLGQNFAGFMHLADHDNALVGGRIWTETEHIEQQLANLTEHMETVIQKYLRNEFETIDDYNAQAGELAEPYRFLVIADFPIGFEGDALRRLNSIALSGARCGVYTLVVRDTRQPLPGGAHLDELEAHSVNLVRQGERFVWKDEVFKQFPLALDPPPSEQFLTEILDVVGRYAKDSKRVEVPFETIAPSTEKIWSGDATDDVRVPIGRLGATRLQMLRLGLGVAQHALIAGKTGSGKSTLLHVLVTNLAMWYGPDEVEFYLVDFKKGVEFKTYATHALPHARAIAVESDREFGLSVLQRIDAELTRRGALFRKLGVQDLPAYRALADQHQGKEDFISIPRTLLIIDEFQEFFSEDDKLSQDAALLLDRLVRQGRAFGVHVLLGSQTIGGTSGLARSTIGQMAVRIALQTSEADSQLILGDNNSAARLLSRPGEAIYNDAGGLVEANSPFQVAWLPDEVREVHLERVAARAAAGKVRRAEPVVFEGNAPADITKNRALMALLTDPKGSPQNSSPPQAWLGDPVAIKPPTAITFRRQSGANALIVGQQEESAMALMAAALLSLAAQQAPATAQFYVLDGSPADSPLAGVFPRLKNSLPHAITLVEYRSVPEAINALSAELKRRQEADQANAPSIYIFIYGLQRYRALRRQEDSFSFSASDEEKATPPDKQFADLLREGAALGMHVVAWADTPVAVERTLDRSSMREFDHRVLFQMSAADSSSLIDSPAANKLGFHRALAYSEEQGVMEKFRPYALPDATLMDRVKSHFAHTGGNT